MVESIDPSLQEGSGATRDSRPKRTLLRTFAPTIATIAVVALCISAGEWQRGRMHAKEALRAQFDAAATAAPLETTALLNAAPEWSAIRYRNVDLRGEYDGRHLMLLDNRVHAGRAGYHVLVPLSLGGGRSVLVNRGWVPVGPTRTELPSITIAEGQTRVRGRVNLPPSGYVELAPQETGTVVWQHLDLARMAAASGLNLLPIVVEEAPPSGPPDGLVRAWPEPDFGINTHRTYMMQWYAFAALAFLYWTWAHRPNRQREGSAGDRT